MSIPAASAAYDEVPYPPMSHPQTHAENLAIAGWLRDLEAAPPGRCRVLELGCGDGLNLAAMASLYPESEYTGLDYSAATIERGRAMLREAGVERVRLETGDIREARPDLGTFDYILAHGVYSWVPEDVRDGLMASIARHLAPDGVAFVSYLALPGAMLREMMRSMMRFHVRAEGDPLARSRQARSLVALLESAPIEKNHYNELLSAEAPIVLNRDEAALFHDELSPVSHPVLFTDFVSHAAEHGLRFLCEAEYLIPPGRNVHEKAREQLRPLEGNRVLFEQYLDFLEGRRFRQTLLCRDNRLGKLRPDRLDSLWISLRAREADEQPEPDNVIFHGPKRSILRARDPVERAALRSLAAHDGRRVPFPEFLGATRARLRTDAPAGWEDSLRNYVLRVAVPGLIELHWGPEPHAPEPGLRPSTPGINRWICLRGSGTVVSLSGEMVEIHGTLGRFLITQLDGSHDAAGLLAAVRGLLEENASLPADRRMADLPAPDTPGLAEQLEKSLRGLAALGLIQRPPQA